MFQHSRIHIALPLMGEREYIQALVKTLDSQISVDFKLHLIINQPDNFWQDGEKDWICINNQETIRFLNSLDKNYEIDILDYSSEGKGWTDRNHGVGWARKTIMDHINQEAGENDIIVSLDGDTTFNPGYLQSLIDNLNKNPQSMIVSVPYYHKLTADDRVNRAMLRYEIYMRNYAINLWRIRSPYTFTALGSAMAFPVSSYRKIGGMTPKKSGEDFYFLQKMRKAGNMLVWNQEKVFPGTRFSDRVFFGTGPAMIKGDGGDWSSYPVYHFTLFDEVRSLYNSFSSIYDGEISPEVSSITTNVFGNTEVWQPLIENSKNTSQFIRAAHYKFDGLRILQFLKNRQKDLVISGEESLRQNLREHFREYLCHDMQSVLSRISFAHSSVHDLNKIRDLLVEIEGNFQERNLIAAPFQ